MAARRTVAVVVGSLRQGSFSKRIARSLAEVAPASLAFDAVDLAGLALYDQDLETDPPPAEWAAFRARIRRADAVLFVTPEYNRSIPGCLKNAIDVGSRPYGQAVWNRKPAAIVSTSPGALGGFGANHHLRQCLVFLDMPVLQQPEAYVGQAASVVGEDGTIASDATREFFTTFMARFADWIERTAAA
jgi:chromate reductase, NAD(P)H dehydrogenase (quinone)